MQKKLNATVEPFGEGKWCVHVIDRDTEDCISLLTGRPVRVVAPATQSDIDDIDVNERWASPASYALMAARPKSLIAPVAARSKPI